MKKISILAFLFMLIAILPLAIADKESQDDDLEIRHENEIEIENEVEIEHENSMLNVSNTTLIEVESMSLRHGAKTRLLQLEKAIERNILLGNATISAIMQVNESANVTELEAIIAELQELKIQVEQVNPEGNGSETARQFVELKNDAIELTKQFRAKARMLVGKEEASDIRLKIKVKSNSEMKELNERIRIEARESNAERLKKIFEAIKVRNDALEDRVRSGNATVSDVIRELQIQLNDLKREQKESAFEEMKEDIFKRQILRQAAVQNAQTNFSERKIERIEQRMEKITDGRIREKMEERIERIENGTRIRIEKRMEIRENGEVRTEERSEIKTDRGKNVAEADVEVKISNRR